MIIIAIVALVALWVVTAQRNLVAADEKVKNSLSQIGVQQSSRWDALTALVELLKSYDEHEYKSLMDVIGQRAKIGGQSTAAEVQTQENLLSGAVKQVIAVSEQYPNLKANELYIKNMDSVNMYENQVRTSRMVYNDCVTRYNNLIRQIPTNFVAALFHFSTREYLAEPEGKTEMPSMKI